MGRLIVIEGLDGAGKRTLAGKLVAELEARGASVAGMAFPRYGEDVHADLVREALHRDHGDLVDSVYGMALLYALDRRAAGPRIQQRLAEHDTLLVDRYIASNAAYGAARLYQDAEGQFVAWLRALEIERFALPVPDAHLLLRVPVQVAASRAVRREHGDAERVRDSFETDEGLQSRCAAVYDQLAAAHWLAPWWIVDGAGGADPSALAEQLLQLGS